MKALVPIADGSEEIEAVVIIDVLRRAGWDVTAAGVGGTTITASRGVRIVADAAWDEVDPATFDVLVLPGGTGGVRRMAADASVLETIRTFIAQSKWVAAICAAPLVLQAAGVLAGRKVTCHPSVRPELTGGELSDARVVTDGRVVTSRGAGTAIEFAIKLVELVDGREAARTVAAGLALDSPR